MYGVCTCACVCACVGWCVVYLVRMCMCVCVRACVRVYGCDAVAYSTDVRLSLRKRPEVLSVQPTHTYIGVVLWELVARAVPFKELPPFQVIYAVGYQHTTPPIPGVYSTVYVVVFVVV